MLRKLLILAGGMGILFGFWGVSRVQATEVCTFNDPLKTLASIQASRDDSSEALQSELRLRREILGRILDCAGEDARRLQGSIKNVSDPDPQVVRLKSRLNGNLDEALRFYEAQKSRLGDLGLQGSKDTAKNIKSWREGNYFPLADQAGNLILWTKNQNLFGTASVRLDQISQTIRTLNLLEAEGMADKHSKAVDQLKDAHSLNARAREALLLGQVPETASLIRDSLSALSQTYQSFFEVSETVKKFIPL